MLYESYFGEHFAESGICLRNLNYIVNILYIFGVCGVKFLYIRRKWLVCNVRLFSELVFWYDFGTIGNRKIKKI